jgi:hypothetical protein
MKNIRITITKDQYSQVSQFLTLINYKLDTKSDLAYYLKFGFPIDSEFIEVEIPLEKTRKTTETHTFIKARYQNKTVSDSEIFSKGKYKGSTYKAIKEVDSSYISWMKDNVENYQETMFV